MLPDPLTPETLEQFRRSLAMLGQGQPSGLDREAAMTLLEELQRLQGKDRRVSRMLEQVTALLDAAQATDLPEGP